MTMLQAVRNLHALGVPLADAVAAATSVPARVARRDDVGALVEGLVEWDQARRSASTSTVPTSRPPAISSVSSDDATPGAPADEEAVPADLDPDVASSSSVANGIATASGPRSTKTTRSFGGSRWSPEPDVGKNGGAATSS